MARVPHHDTDAATLAERELEAKNIPLMCPECNAVTGYTPARFTFVLSESTHEALGQCENCKERFVPVDADANPITPDAGEWDA